MPTFSFLHIFNGVFFSYRWIRIGLQKLMWNSPDLRLLNVELLELNPIPIPYIIEFSSKNKNNSFE